MDKFIHLMSRKTALRLGVTYYFTGKPCKHGHIATRNVKSSACHMCVKSIYLDWYKENKEAVKARNRIKSKEWALLNPDRIRLNAIRARDKVKFNPVLRKEKNLYMRCVNSSRRHKVKKGQAKEIAQWAKGAPKVCFYCKAPCENYFHIDHFYPLSKGGEHKLENVVISCPICNLKKSNKNPHEFIDSLNL